MNEIEKIKESLARFQHSTATMRLANPPFVEGVSREQVEALIAENDDKHVLDITQRLAETTAALEETRRMHDAAKANADANLTTIKQLFVRVDDMKSSHSDQLAELTTAVSAYKQIIAEHEVTIAALQSRSWWQHTKDCIKGWFGR